MRQVAARVMRSAQWKGFALKTFKCGYYHWFSGLDAGAQNQRVFLPAVVRKLRNLWKALPFKRRMPRSSIREYAEKIDKASLEIDGIFDMIKAQGVVEKQKIIEDANKVAQKMKEDAQARIEQELKKASGQLRSEAVALSVQMAEEILKKNITAQDHEAMVKEYMDKVVNKN